MHMCIYLDIFGAMYSCELRETLQHLPLDVVDGGWAGGQDPVVEWMFTSGFIFEVQSNMKSVGRGVDCTAWRTCKSTEWNFDCISVREVSICFYGRCSTGSWLLSLGLGVSIWLCWGSVCVWLDLQAKTMNNQFQYTVGNPVFFLLSLPKAERRPLPQHFLFSINYSKIFKICARCKHVAEGPRFTVSVHHRDTRMLIEFTLCCSHRVRSTKEITYDRPMVPELYLDLHVNSSAFLWRKIAFTGRSIGSSGGSRRATPDYLWRAGAPQDRGHRPPCVDKVQDNPIK